MNVPPSNSGDAAAEPAPVVVYELSGWWRRVGASLLDGLIVSLAAIPIELAIDLGFGGDILLQDPEASFEIVSYLRWQAAGAIVEALLFIPLVVVVMGLNNGQSLGKMAAKIRVIREDGQPVNVGFAMKRELLVKSILFGWFGILTLMIAPLLDSLWPLWDDENRALHDRMVRTRVVRTDIAPAPYGGQLGAPLGMPPPPIGYAPPPSGPPATPPYQVPPYPAPPFPVAPPRPPENPPPPGEG